MSSEILEETLCDRLDDSRTNNSFRVMENTDLNFYADDLQKHFGIIWTVWEFMGLSVFEERRQKGWKRSLGFAKELLYPVILLSMLLYCCYDILWDLVLNYSTILDVVIQVLPCILWCMMYKRRTSLKYFLIRIANNTIGELDPSSRCISLSINAALLLLVIYQPLLLIMQKIQGKKLKLAEICRYIQETIFPSLIAITYTIICYTLLQRLRECKTAFQTKLDILSSTSTRVLLKNYLVIIKEVETFEELFCNPVFILVVEDFCSFSIRIMDILDREFWSPKHMLETYLYFLLIFAILGILVVCAANIPLEILKVKSVLLEKLSSKLCLDELVETEVQIDFLLRRDGFDLTAGKIVSFDRSFLLKAFATVTAQAVVFYQLGSRQI